jgi:hypothetical protein
VGQHDAGAFLDSAIICASYVLVNISRDLNNSSATDLICELTRVLVT